MPHALVSVLLSAFAGNQATFGHIDFEEIIWCAVNYNLPPSQLDLATM